MAYGVVRTDNMSGTTLGKNLVSLKYQESSVDTAIDNGNVVVVGDLIEGEREIRLASKPAADTALKNIALVATPELNKDKKVTLPAEYTNAAGTILRGYRLLSHDIFSVTADALAGDTLSVGYAVELQAGTKLKVVSSATSDSTQVGKIIAIEGDWYVIEVA